MRTAARAERGIGRSIMPFMQKRTIGIASTLVGAALWGFSGTCSQFLLENYAISSLFITMVRMLGAGALFIAVIAVRYRAQARGMLADRHARRRLLLFGIAGLYLCQLTYVIAIGYTNAGTATVMQSLNIVMIMIVSCMLARRLPRRPEVTGLVLAIVATAVIATQGDLGTLSLSGAALFWGFATAATAAAYSMLSTPLSRGWGSFVTTGLGMFAGGVAGAAVWIAAFFVPGIDTVASAGNAMGTALIPELDAVGVGALVVIIVVGTFGAFFLYLHGMALVGAVQGSQLGAIEPVSATVCSAALVGTSFSSWDWIGLALMVGTILLVAAGKGDASKIDAPEPAISAGEYGSDEA